MTLFSRQNLFSVILAKIVLRGTKLGTTEKKLSSDMKTIEMNNTTTTSLSSDTECDNMEVRSYVGPVETFQVLGEQNRAI